MVDFIIKGSENGKGYGVNGVGGGKMPGFGAVPVSYTHLTLPTKA